MHTSRVQACENGTLALDDSSSPLDIQEYDSVQRGPTSHEIMQLEASSRDVWEE